jgi:hypothetical protein
MPKNTKNSGSAFSASKDQKAQIARAEASAADLDKLLTSVGFNHHLQTLDSKSVDAKGKFAAFCLDLWFDAELSYGERILLSNQLILHQNLKAVAKIAVASSKRVSSVKQND